jgi:hypothetical protein
MGEELGDGGANLARTQKQDMVHVRGTPLCCFAAASYAVEGDPRCAVVNRRPSVVQYRLKYPMKRHAKGLRKRRRND